jgi:DNA-binding response OmpR family regulator
MPTPSRSRQRLKQWRNALVVVNDDALRAVIVELLAQEHFAAFDVETMVEGRYLLLTRACELVVVDPGAADVDEVRVFLADLDRWPTIRSVVVLTDRPSIARVASEADVTCLREPFDLDELLLEVQHATKEMERKAR